MISESKECVDPSGCEIYYKDGDAELNDYINNYKCYNIAFL
jgi:pimeloyl-CoA synthetase